ncbi:pilus assembly protein TadG-related protein [Streptomyces albireticuli]|uniref:pilus assembly protein TadG-related protein n=1 Tax=Streptomyces albireticuli TaxID=1940 RepID=UPI0036945262
MTGRTARRRAAGDAGQAFPVYLTAVAGLLFLALAFFAVGRAGADKNGAQTAADAAALAAAQSYRDQLRTGLLTALGGLTGDLAGDPAGGGANAAWTDWLTGRAGSPDAACGAAASYATLNGAGLVGDCEPPDGGLPAAFTVTVRATDPVGRSVVPGTEDTHATATARAVVEPRCAAGRPAGEPSPRPSGGVSPGPSGTPSPGRPAPVEIVCGGEVVTIDPARPGDLARAARALFAVRLAD